MRHLLFIGYGLVGMALFYVGRHLYYDHQNLHALIRFAVQAAQQAPPS